MFHMLSEKINAFRQRLTRLDRQPLGRAALVIILLLDLFILASVFRGLADHTRQLSAPEETIPPLCQDIVIDRTWNTQNRLDRISSLVSGFATRRFPLERETREPSREHRLCAPIVSAFEAIRTDGELARGLNELRHIKQENTTLRAGLEQVKGAYDSQLLEKIAGEKKPGPSAEGLRKQLDEQITALDESVRREGELGEMLEKAPKIQAFYQLMEGVSDADRTGLANDLRRLNFWYPAKRLGWQMLFLLPLLAVFYFWNSRSVARDRPYQMLVSSHLLVVATIPLLFKIIELAYDILPRRFFRHLIDLLEAIKLVAIWHYLVIAVAIAVAMALIYLFQRKLFSPERVLQRRIARGECHACGLRLPPGSRHCPACGAAQFRECRHCHQQTLTHCRFCTFCGQAD